MYCIFLLMVAGACGGAISAPASTSISTSTSTSTSTLPIIRIRGGASDPNLPDPSDPRVASTQRLVQSATSLLSSFGHEEALIPFLSQGVFKHGDTYLFIYVVATGKVLFNSAFPSKEGHVVLGGEDSNGKLFHDEMIATGVRGGGWVKYVWPKPDSPDGTPGEPANKFTFCSPCTIDGVECVVMSGFYE